MNSASPAVAGSRKQSTQSDNLDYICPICQTQVTTSKSIECDKCRNWFHQKCGGITNPEFNLLSKSNSAICWYCEDCILKKKQGHEGAGNVDGKLDNILSILTGIDGRMRGMDNRIANLEQQNVKQTTYIDNRIDVKVRDVVKEELDKDRRKLNLIIHGVEEITGGSASDSTANDQAQVQAVMEAVNPELPPAHSNILRLGEKKDGRVRPIRISVDSFNTKKSILGKSKVLSQHMKFSRVYISPDLTMAEREENNKLRQELKTRRENGEKDLIISRGQIVRRTPQGGEL
jgi:hypothetical protein